MLHLAYRATAILINSVLALLLIISSYGYLVPPEKWVIPAYLGLAFPIFLAANLFFVVFWLLHKKKKGVFVSVVTLLICFPAVYDYFPIHFKADAPTGETLNIMTYNVHGFGSYKEKTRDVENKIIAYIKGEQPDIVCIQEYTASLTGELITRDDIIKEFSDYPYYHFMKLSATPYSESGLATFSKFPILNFREQRYAESYNGFTQYKIKIHDDTLTLINCHLESNKLTTTDRELYSMMVKNMETSLLGEVNHRLVRKMSSAYRLRAKQANDIDSIMRKTTGRKLVCGDFNDVTQSYAYQKAKGKMKDAYVHSGTGPGITYNANLFWFRIDHILYNNPMYPIKSTLGRLKISDHYPLSVLFQWNKKGN